MQARVPTSTRLLALLGASIGLTAAASAQGFPTTDPANDLFVPNQYVPLSQFVSTDEPQGELLTMNVQDDVLTRYANANIRVARSHNGNVTLTFPTTVDHVADEVTLNARGPGSYVVVSLELTNDLPLVTHWDASLNVDSGGHAKGGQSEGATDSIRTWKVNAAGDALTGEGGDIRNSEKDCAAGGHCHPQYGAYQWQSDVWALFSDGSETGASSYPADQLAPAHERYIAENWALSGATDEALIWQSDKARELTGFPVAHRNYSGSGQFNSLEEDVPVFQIAHGFILERDDPIVPGREDSLATFLLPPGWVSNPSGDGYPMLIGADYDTYNSTFGAGPGFLTVIGDLVNTDPDWKTLGVYWNGGGAQACQTIHESAYQNVKSLFDHMDSALGGDRHAILAIGGSRGATSALAIAGNPHVPLNAYTVEYAMPVAAQTNPGLNYSTVAGVSPMNNPTYRHIQNGARALAGFEDAWKPGWTGPGGKSGNALVLSTIVGEEDSQTVTDFRSNSSPDFIAALANRGTKVILRQPTHDFAQPFSNTAEYVELLEAAGVDLRFEIHYRAGHGSYTNVQPDLETVLSWMHSGNDDLQTGTFYYRRMSAAQYDVPEEFTPSYEPLILEAPIATGLGQEYSLNIVGEPGTQWEIRVPQFTAYLESNPWPGPPVDCPTSLGTPFLSGTLPTSTADRSFDNVFFSLPQLLAYGGFYCIQFRYLVPGASQWVELGPGDTAHPFFTGVYWNSDDSVLWAKEPVAPGEWDRLGFQENLPWLAPITIWTGGVSSDQQF